MVVALGALLILLAVIFVVVAINDEKGRLAHVAADARKALTPPAQPPVPAARPAPPPATQPERRFPLAGNDAADRPAFASKPAGNPASWFSNDDYPAEARRRNEEGRVMIRLKIDPHGVPRACAIASGSGSITLDNATCDLALRRARFVPARDADGKAVWGSWASGIRWQLTDEP